MFSENIKTEVIAKKFKTDKRKIRIIVIKEVGMEKYRELKEDRGRFFHEQARLKCKNLYHNNKKYREKMIKNSLNRYYANLPKNRKQ